METEWWFWYPYYISENVTLAKSIYKLGSISHKVTISDVWVFDTKYKMALPLIKDYFGMIYSDPDHEEVAANFEQVYLVLQYMNMKAMKLGFKKNC